MIINGPNGVFAKVTPDGMIRVLSIAEEMMHRMAVLGKVWSLGGTIIAADATDNVIFYFTNTSDEDLEIHHLLVSPTIAGLVTVEKDRIYSSGGGTALVLGNWNTSSGITKSQTSYLANDIVLTGTAKELNWCRVAANSRVDLIPETSVIIVAPNGSIAVRFAADSGTPTVAVACQLHGEEPWEE